MSREELEARQRALRQVLARAASHAIEFPDEDEEEEEEEEETPADQEAVWWLLEEDDDG